MPTTSAVANRAEIDEREASGSKRRVLVVDDDPRIRKLVSVALRRAGYAVILAADGVQALEFLAKDTPDLVISDVMMPRMDGFALIRELRADAINSLIPVIFLTARGKTDDVVHGLGLGADDYLAKPFEMPELLARVRSKIERPPLPAEFVSRERQTGFLTEERFWHVAQREFDRAQKTGRSGGLACLAFAEFPLPRSRLGPRSESEIAKQVAGLIHGITHPIDVVAHSADGRFLLLLPEATPAENDQRLGQLSRQIARFGFIAGTTHIRLTPTIGYVQFEDGAVLSEVRERLELAAQGAATLLDLRPQRYDPARHVPQSPPIRAPFFQLIASYAGSHLRVPLQIALAFFLGVVAPFCGYVLLDRIGLDISGVMYVFVAIALGVTTYFIWHENILALRHVEPPADSGGPYPRASAIIAAYLPNEASTILDTIEAFLRLDYPGGLQILLAYNTPRDLPVEAELREIARRDRRFVPLRVVDSSSKAQNINAALKEVRGEFVGIFDADHHPEPGSFTRAWRWLAHGADIVQGHCVVRNGDESWVSRAVAVEFEMIYALNHPGRAALHGFGIFGGSNGFWRTDLLRELRLRNSMLTEDIDSSIRAVLDGATVISDPGLISREFAPVTVKALWNQRMRWAQGWFQVSLHYAQAGMKSGELSVRQRLGFFHLLVWREIYPWISMQMFPIVAFWIWRDGVSSFNWFVPLFVLTTLFTQSAAPGQVLFAYKCSAPDIRARKAWFVSYLFVSFFLYVPFKNLIAVVGQMKELMRERHWNVTPRPSAVKQEVPVR